MEKTRLNQLRIKIAREAATLLYTLQEKEYKQAKMRAAYALRSKVLPSNHEIANEIDKIANEAEGSLRQERLLQMRKHALQIMNILKEYSPKLSTYDNK